MAITAKKRRDNTKNAIKGSRFRAWLIGKLLMDKRFCVAVPEPDFGDDLWASRIEGSGRVIRAQLKAAFHFTKKKDALRYMVNASVKAFDKRIETNDVYFVGLYDDKLDTFDVAGIPIGKLAEFRKRTWRTKQGKRQRYMFNFLKSGSKFAFWCKAPTGKRRTETIDFTRHFADPFAAIK